MWRSMLPVTMRKTATLTLRIDRQRQACMDSEYIDVWFRDTATAWRSDPSACGTETACVMARRVFPRPTACTFVIPRSLRRLRPLCASSNACRPRPSRSLRWCSQYAPVERVHALPGGDLIAPYAVVHASIVCLAPALMYTACTAQCAASKCHNHRDRRPGAWMGGYVRTQCYSFHDSSVG